MSRYTIYQSLDIFCAENTFMTSTYSSICVIMGYISHDPTYNILYRDKKTKC